MEIIWQLEFWELNLRIRMLEIKFWKKLELFEDWSFENYIKELELWKINLKEIRILKIIWELELWKLNYENWNFGNWKLNSEIEILKNYLKMKVLKINK